MKANMRNAILIQVKVWAACLIATLGITETAFAVPVTVEVNWPNWSSENRVLLKSSSGDTLQTICNPTNCYNGQSSAGYSNTFNFDLPEGLDYIVDLQDRYGDGWDGTGAYVRLYSDGKLVFQDAGPPSNFQTATFDVSSVQVNTGSQSCSALTGTWSGNSATTSSGVGVSINRTVESGGSWDGFSAHNLNTINTFSEASVQGHTSLATTFRWDTTPSSTTMDDAHNDGVTGTFTVNFDQAVVNPVFHFDRIGGSAGTTSNSSRFSLISSGNLVKLAGPAHFEVFDKFVQRTIYETLSGTATTESSLTSTQGTAAGSFYVSGTHSSITFSFEGAGVEGTGGDAFEMAVCANPSTSGTLGDYGDAPASYGNPFSDQQGSFQLGSIVTEETSSPYDNSAADDDGVTIPSLTQGQAATIPVIFQKSSAVQSYINAWIDWNDDGDFDDSGEQIATNLPSTAASGIENISVNVPIGAATSATFARFRIGSVAGISATGSDSFGEVEDYALTINAASGGGAVCGIDSDKENNWASGNLNYNEVNMDASGLNMSVAVTGATGQFDRIVGGSFNGVSGLDMRTNGFPDGGATFTYSFSTDVSSVGFDIGHINTGGGGGDYFLITARDSLGNTVYPTFTSSGSSYTATSSTGIVDANGSTPENLGVYFEDSDLISEVIIYWDDCTTCGASFHGMVIGEMEPCLPPTTLAGSKTVSVWDPGNEGLYSVPGNDVVYEITVSNTGIGATDPNSVLLIDVMPPDVELFTGNFDGSGNPVSFSQSTGAGLIWNYSTDVGYSKSQTGKPTTFAQCNDPITAGYDAGVTYICFNPKGALASGNPDPEFTLSFRARIK